VSIIRVDVLPTVSDIRQPISARQGTKHIAPDNRDRAGHLKDGFNPSLPSLMAPGQSSAIASAFQQKIPKPFDVREAVIAQSV
jgi:hypothetical protein